MYNYRCMTIDDIEQVHKIECEVFSKPWSINAFKDEMNNENAYYYVVEKDNKVIGYAGLWKILDEGHITNVAVSKKFQGQGLGTSLLKKLIEKTEKSGIKSFTLEVRKSNTKAINIYKRLGFKEVGFRKNFYEEPKEDAIIMWTKPVR